MNALIVENERLFNNTKDAQRAIYHCHRTDKTDRALGLVLNNFPEREKLKILFLRESEGVYRFGSKRVYIKVEKGDQVFVRVGGGFMHIEDFIEQFTALEVDKVERKDVTYKFKTKRSIQKIAVAALKKDGGRENSPIRSPQRADSPGRSYSPVGRY